MGGRLQRVSVILVILVSLGKGARLGAVDGVDEAAREGGLVEERVVRAEEVVALMTRGAVVVDLRRRSVLEQLKDWNEEGRKRRRRTNSSTSSKEVKKMHFLV